MNTFVLDTVEASPQQLSAAPQAEPELQARGIVKRFGKTTILQNVDLSLGRGEAVALIGENGAGKSSLLRCCLRLIEPDEGSVALFGQDITRVNQRELRRLRARAGFIFQKHNLVPRMSALSNVLHGVQARKHGPGTWLQSIATREDREEALHCLAMVGLAGKAMQRVDRLSGGQSQRVAIARALMQRPRLVVADEPVASLDPQAGDEVMELFAGLMREHSLSVVFTSHNLTHALKYSDRIIALRDGCVVYEGQSCSQEPGALRQYYEAA